jgi:hypothetical protein
MQRVAMLIATLAVGAFSCAASVEPVRLTVVLDFEQPYGSEEAIHAMRAEAATQLRDAGLNLDWATAEESSRRQDLGSSVIFKMRGKCAMDSFPLLADELGLPLAITHSTDGDILTFGAVDCDRVRSSLKRTMSGSDYSRGDYLYGRALGRVMAHEMYHMLAGSTAHAKKGVTRECLSGRELVRDGLMMPDHSLRAIREQMALMKKRDGVSGRTPDNAIPPASSLP